MTFVHQILVQSQEFPKKCFHFLLEPAWLKDQGNGLLTNMQSDEWIDHNVD